MAAVEFEFIKNKSRFKCLHFSDQMHLMIWYLRERQLPFDKMTENQRKYFLKMAKNYSYDAKKDKLSKNVMTGRRYDKESEHKYLQQCL